MSLPRTLFALALPLVLLACAAAAAPTPIAVTTQRGADPIRLFAEQRMCPGDFKYAEYEVLSAGGTVIPGCWRLDREGNVFMGWADGDLMGAPTKAFEWADGHKPNRYI